MCLAVFGYRLTVCRDILECGTLLTFLDLSRKGIPEREISGLIRVSARRKEGSEEGVAEWRSSGC